MIRQAVAVTLGTFVLATALYGSGQPRHMRLVRAEPASDTTITQSPSSIRLWFSESPQEAVSRVSLTLGGEEVPVGETRGTGDSLLVVDVTTELAPGRYTVRWRTAGDDGHVLRDTFDFTLAASDHHP